jgi:hypothetical protein
LGLTSGDVARTAVRIKWVHEGEVDRRVPGTYQLDIVSVKIGPSPSGEHVFILRRFAETGALPNSASPTSRILTCPPCLSYLRLPPLWGCFSAVDLHRVVHRSSKKIISLFHGYLSLLGR